MNFCEIDRFLADVAQQTQSNDIESDDVIFAIFFSRNSIICRNQQISRLQLQPTQFWTIILSVCIDFAIVINIAFLWKKDLLNFQRNHVLNAIIVY